MLDADLAQLYDVTTGNLNKAVKRNQARFPGDFMFQLTDKEMESLLFQSGRSKGRGGRRHRPYVFTEQGVAMLSSVLNSERAVQVNIAIMRTFVQLRRLMDSNADLARKIESLEKKYDEKFAAVFAAIKQLIAPTEPAKKRIGFHP
jgi:ORF6N domain-containing protein